MIFQTKYISELFQLVENEHSGTEFYEIFLKCVSDKEDSGASEYEIYFNYMLQYHPNEIKVRLLSWKHLYKIPENSEHIYVSLPYYARNIIL
jgi:hypothetical protein